MPLASRKSLPSQSVRAVSAALPAASAAVASPSGIEGVLLTGTIGAGKTSIAVEIGDILGEQGVRAAVMDLDWLGWTTMEGTVDLIWENLADVWQNYMAAGAERAVMARLVQDDAELQALRRAAPELAITVVRVESPPEIVRDRLLARDSGRHLESHLGETAALAEAGVGLEDFSVTNGDGPLRDVALEVLDRLGWT